MRKGAPVLDELYTALKDNNQAILHTLVDLDLLPGTTSHEYSEFWQEMSSRELWTLVKLVKQSTSTLALEYKEVENFLRRSLEPRRIQKAKSEEKRRRPMLGPVCDRIIFHDPANLPSSGVIGSFITTLADGSNAV